MNINSQLDVKIQRWKIEQKILKESKALEMKLRKEICTEIFENKQGKFKTEYKDLKLESKVTIKLDEERWEIYKNSPDLDPNVLNAVKDKPTLVMSAMKNIDEDSKFWNLISEHPAAPAITIIKNKKKNEAFITLA